MVGLDRGGRAAERDRFDHVRVERALGEPGHVAQLPRLVLEHGDELAPDPLPLHFGVGDTTQNLEESRRCIDMDQVDLECVPEGVDDRLRLALPEEAVVHEDTRELVADGPVDQDGDDRGVDPARERAEHALVADRVPDRVHGGIDEAGHGPRAGDAADVEEVVEDLLALRGVDDLRVELDGVESPPLVRHRGDRAVRGGAERGEPLGRAQHRVAVAHPDRQAPLSVGLEAAEEAARAALDLDLRFAVLASLRRHDVAAEEVPHRLHAVADAEHGHAGVEERLRGERRAVLVDARGAAREDDALVAVREDLLERVGAGEDLGVHGHLPDPAGDQLRVLAPEVQDRDLVGRAHAAPGATGAVPASGPAGRPSLRS